MAKYGEDVVALIQELYDATFELAKRVATDIDLDEFEVPTNLEFKNVSEVEASLLKAASGLNKVCAKVLSVYNQPDPNAEVQFTKDMGEIELTKDDLNKSDPHMGG